MLAFSAMPMMACKEKVTLPNASAAQSSQRATLCGNVKCPRVGDYEEIWNEPVVLIDGSVIQGSATQGGLQPDYEIDTNQLAVKAFLDVLKARVAKETEYWPRVDAAIAAVQQALPNGGYTFGPYRSVMKQFKDAGERIPLEAYLEVNGGVCRENAIFLNLALSAAGVPSYYAYFVAQMGPRIEDHAVVLIKDENAQDVYVVDSYNSAFNARRLSDLATEKGAQREHLTAPLKKASFFAGARLVRLNAYPRYWLPERKDPLNLQNDAFIDRMSTLESGGFDRN